jgi:hypothetical protein
VGDPAEVPVIEAKAWEQTGSEDPFAAQTREKRTRVAAHQGRQAQNVGAAVKRGDALPPGVTLSSMLDGRSGAALGARLGRDGLKQTAARVATASGGTLRLSFCPRIGLRRRASRCAAHSALAFALGGAPRSGRTTPRKRRTPTGGGRRLRLPRAGYADSFALGTRRRRSDSEGQTLR